MADKWYTVKFQRDDDIVTAAAKASSASQAKEQIKERHYTSAVRIFKIISVVER